MNTTAIRYRYATATLAVLIILACLFLWYRRAGEGDMSPVATSTATSTLGISQEDLEKLPVGGKVNTGGYTIERIDIPSGLPKAPDYKKPLVFNTDLTADARAFLNTKLANTIAALDKDPYDANAWLSLGSARKIAGDYQGAAAAWEYLTKLSPKVSIAYNNLGDLYMNFLKDYPKAESRYLTAVATAPSEDAAYAELFVLYSNFYKQGTGAAQAIVLKGVKSVPDSINLQVLLARSYKADGKTAEADAAYTAAIKAATAQGQADMATQIKAEAGK